jgi:hypothetical protein
MRSLHKALAAAAVTAAALALPATLRARDDRGAGAGQWTNPPGQQGQGFGQGSGQWRDQGSRDFGQYGQNQFQGGQDNDQGQGFGTGGRQERQVRGRVLRIKSVELPRIDTEICVALIQTTNGRRMVVDLGPAEDLGERQLSVNKGDEITARGYVSRVGPYPILMADRATINGQSVSVDRTWPETLALMRREERQLVQESQGQRGYQRRMNYPSATRGEGEGGEFAEIIEFEVPGQGGRGFQGNQPGAERGMRGGYHLQGQIVRKGTIQVPGTSAAIELATVKTSRGRQALVVLGPQQELGGLELNQGEQLQITGFPVWVNGQEVVLANEVTANNQTFPALMHHAQAGRRIQGQVSAIKTLQVPGLKEPLAVGMLKSDQGQTFIVVLGPEDKLRPANLEHGGKASVNGELLRFQGHQVLLARQLTANGHTINVVREQQGQFEE